MSFALGSAPELTLIQDITDMVFRDLLKVSFPVEEVNVSDAEESITYEAMNTVRYIAGYVCRTLAAKIDKT